MATFNATFTESNQFDATFVDSENLSAAFGEIQYIQVGDYYEGEYTITPTDAEQIIPTAEKLMSQNLVINPIPTNYGRITWDGTTLMVS